MARSSELGNGIGSLRSDSISEQLRETSRADFNSQFEAQRRERGALRPKAVHQRATLSGPIQSGSMLRPQSEAPKGIISAFTNTCKRWRMSADEQATLLGYKRSAPLVMQILAGQMRPSSQDFLDRIGFILGISLGLGSMFNESAEAENKWLRFPRNEFEGKSALEKMLEGHMIGLIAVSELVNRERGL